MSSTNGINKSIESVKFAEETHGVKINANIPKGFKLNLTMAGKADGRVDIININVVQDGETEQVAEAYVDQLKRFLERKLKEGTVKHVSGEHKRCYRMENALDRYYVDFVLNCRSEVISLEFIPRNPDAGLLNVKFMAIGGCTATSYKVVVSQKHGGKVRDLRFGKNEMNYFVLGKYCNFQKHPESISVHEPAIREFLREMLPPLRLRFMDTRPDGILLDGMGLGYIMLVLILLAEREASLTVVDPVEISQKFDMLMGGMFMAEFQVPA